MAPTTSRRSWPHMKTTLLRVYGRPAGVLLRGAGGA
jgi:hypothetical protein